jgi:hypothetical protein
MSETVIDNPMQLVDSLDAEAIRRELDDLEQREDALRILYKVAIARRRKRDAERPAAATAG